MKKLLPILSLVIILFSCRNENEFIGKWYEINEESRFEFKNDSLIVSNPFFYKGAYRISKNTIYFKYDNMFNDSLANQTYIYKLNHDSLAIQYATNPNEKTTLIKAKSFTDFILKKNYSNIDLGSNEKAEYQSTNTKYGIKVFIEKIKDSISIKTEYSKNIENLNYDITCILNELEPNFKNEYNTFKDRWTFDEWIKTNIYYSLFVDKNISENDIAKVVKKLRKSDIHKIYRTYETKEEFGIPFDNLKEVKL